MTFSTSPVSVRCCGPLSNWMLLLTVVLWAECLVGYNCAVITRRDVNDIVENNSETPDEEEETSGEVTKEPVKLESEYMNCFPATSCYEDCTERLKGKMHIGRDCQALGAEYGFFPTFVCQCHFEDVIHEEDDEGSNELPIFPPRFYKSSKPNTPKSKRSKKDDSLFLVSND